MAKSSFPPAADTHSAFDEIDIHTGTIEPLIQRARHVSHPTDVVIAPVKLHRRNMKLRLTAADKPLDAFHFTDHADVAAHVLDQAGKQSQSLDRVDRLSLIEGMLDDDTDGGDGVEAFRRVIGGEPTANAKVVEQARTAVAAISNYHPTRWEALHSEATMCPMPLDADVEDILDGALGVKRELIRRQSKVPSSDELVRRATRLIHTTDGAAWEPPAPSIERVTVVGLSSIPAPLVDLLTVLAEQTDVDVHLVLRDVTGPFLQQRLQQVAVEHPGRGVLQ
jgi:hypothetical protein